MSFISKVLRSQGNRIYLVLTPFPDGRNAWYFVRVQPAKATAFFQAVTSGPTALEDYGEVLRRGWGKKPPQVIMDEMKDIYGYNPESSS